MINFFWTYGSYTQNGIKSMNEVTTEHINRWNWLKMDKKNKITCLFWPNLEKELWFLSQNQLKQLDGDKEPENLTYIESQLPIGIIDWPKANDNFNNLKELLNIDNYTYLELKAKCLLLLKPFSRSQQLSKTQLETINYSKLLSTGSEYISEVL